LSDGFTKQEKPTKTQNQTKTKTTYIKAGKLAIPAFLILKMMP
jgi:hypothetical protein